MTPFGMIFLDELYKLNSNLAKNDINCTRNIVNACTTDKKQKEDYRKD